MHFHVAVVVLSPVHTCNLSKQLVEMLQVERFLRQSRTLLRLCCLLLRLVAVFGNKVERVLCPFDKIDQIKLVQFLATSRTIEQQVVVEVVVWTTLSKVECRRCQPFSFIYLYRPTFT